MLCLDRRRLKRLQAPEHLQTGAVLTCVVFSFGEDVSRIRENLGKKEGRRARRVLERVVCAAMKEHGLHEGENTGCLITAFTNNSYAAVQCCVKVEEAVKALALPTVGEEAKGDDYEISAARRGRRGEEEAARIRMGVSSGEVRIVQQVKRAASFRGRCVVEATRVATEINPGFIIVASSAWFALSEAEVKTLGGATKFVRYVQDVVILHYKQVRTEVMVVNRFPTRSEHVEAGNTIVVLDPLRSIQSCLNKVRASKRRHLLKALCRSWGSPKPHVYKNFTDDDHCDELLKELLESVYPRAPRRDVESAESTETLHTTESVSQEARTTEGVSWGKGEEDSSEQGTYATLDWNFSSGY